MLDDAIKEQLTSVFAGLTRPLSLVLRPITGEGEHREKHAELLDLARDVASTSNLIDVQIAGDPAPHVEMALLADGAETGVVFRGVPGGHELTSLVLALLNASGKGKIPDAATTARIRAIAGPAKLRTYVSLECTNCPDVVQALNLVSLLHPEISHEMVDGGLFIAEVEKLGIQGVPAVFLGDTLIHSGKGGFVQLLEVLENKLGVSTMAANDDAAKVASTPPKQYDVVVVGAGPAGASAAIYSARKGLRTAMIAETLGGQLQETLGIENMVGTKYTEGKKLAAELETHVRAYAVDVLEHRRVVSVTSGEKRSLVLSSGERIDTDTLIVATGAKWRELGVSGEREYLGRGVAFCPHCDGPFYAKKRVAVVGGGNSGIEAAIDLSGIATQVTVIEFADTLKADAVLISSMKKRANIDVITSARTAEIKGDGAKVNALVYEDRKDGTMKTLELDGVFVQIGLVPNSAFVKDVVDTNRYGEIVVDDKGRTSAAGIYAAGDVTTAPWKQIVIAMGEGAKVALSAFEERTLRAG